MTTNDYTRIICKRHPFNKKGLLLVLCTFFPLEEIKLDETNKSYIVPFSYLRRHTSSHIHIINTLAKKFSVNDYIDKGNIIYQYGF